MEIAQDEDPAGGPCISFQLIKRDESGTPLFKGQKHEIRIATDGTVSVHHPQSSPTLWKSLGSIDCCGAQEIQLVLKSIVSQFSEQLPHHEVAGH